MDYDLVSSRQSVTQPQSGIGPKIFELVVRDIDIFDWQMMLFQTELFRPWAKQLHWNADFIQFLGLHHPSTVKAKNEFRPLWMICPAIRFGYAERT